MKKTLLAFCYAITTVLLTTHLYAQTGPPTPATRTEEARFYDR